MCFSLSCSKLCMLGKDEVDYIGSAGSDGIDDLDVVFDDCVGVEDGIMGIEWICVEFVDVVSG